MLIKQWLLFHFIDCLPRKALMYQKEQYISLFVSCNHTLERRKRNVFFRKEMMLSVTSNSLQAFKRGIKLISVCCLRTLCLKKRSFKVFIIYQTLNGISNFNENVNWGTSSIDLHTSCRICRYHFNVSR